MTFESEGDFRYWLKINGYMQDSIDEIANKWNTVSIVNGQITDSVTQNSVQEKVTTEVTDEVSNI
jgi:hypothetical protein